MPVDWAGWPVIRKLRWLRPAGLLLLAGCAMLLAVVDISLRLAGYRRTRALLSRFASPTGAVAVLRAPAAANTTAWIGLIVGIAGRHGLWPTSCLRQALLCWLLLARRGIAAEVRIGVDIDRDGGFAAHAWVESAGAIVVGGEHVRERYCVLL